MERQNLRTRQEQHSGRLLRKLPCQSAKQGAAPQ